MFFLSDLSEYRAFGSKDKQPRKRNLLKRAALIGAGVAGLGLAGYGLHKGFKMLNKVKNTNIGKAPNPPSAPNVQVKERWSGGKPPQQTKTNVNYDDINDVRLKLNDPDPTHEWQFNNSNELITFGRGKDRKKRAKRMGRFGAKVRVGVAGAMGTAVGAGIGSMIYGKSGGLIGAGLGGALGTTGSYIEHKRSAYSPIGKKKWKNYKQPPKWYGIPTDRLDLIGER